MSLLEQASVMGGVLTATQAAYYTKIVKQMVHNTPQFMDIDALVALESELRKEVVKKTNKTMDVSSATKYDCIFCIHNKSSEENKVHYGALTTFSRTKKV